MNKLQKVQNTAARIIFRISKYEHIQPYLKELHWLPVSARIEYKLASLCYKSITDSKFPSYIRELLELYVPSRYLRSSNDTHLFKIPKYEQSSFGKKAFRYAGPSTWNSLSAEIRHSKSLDIFKRSLKTSLFISSYSNDTIIR